MDDRLPASSPGGVCIAEHSGAPSQVLALLFSRCAQEARRMVSQLDEAFAALTEQAGGRGRSAPPLDGMELESLTSATRRAGRSLEDFKLIEARVATNLGELGPEAAHTPAAGVPDLREAIRAFSAAIGLRPRDAVTMPVDETRPSTPPMDLAALPAALAGIVAAYSFARPAMLESADAMEAVFRFAWRQHLARVADRPSVT